MMKINIWSDIRCPFCYIGKRKFEKALQRFAHKDKVEIIWRSFQLDPNLKTEAGVNTYDHLAKIKGMTREQTEEMHDHVTAVAKQAGLDFNFENVVVANSFDAHRLIQLAKSKGLGSQAEELLFKAHFSDGRNIDNRDTLAEIGHEIGLAADDVEKMLGSDAFSKEVKDDEMMAHSLGIRSVPFFILNDKLAVSGAQAPELFLQALEKAWRE